MIIRLVFDSQFCGKVDTVLVTHKKLSDQEIKDLFSGWMGIPFDQNCSYEILDRRFCYLRKRLSKNDYKMLVKTSLRR